MKCKEMYINDPRNLKYARTKGITGKECSDVLGCTELRKAMSNLRRNPFYKVTDIWEEGENKFGDPVKYKRYFVERKKIIDITK